MDGFYSRTLVDVAFDGTIRVHHMRKSIGRYEIGSAFRGEVSGSRGRE